jgi:hypothetical protein
MPCIRASPYGDYGGQSGSWKDLSMRTFTFPCEYHPTNGPHPYFAFFYPLPRGHAVAQLVQALRYKPKGRGFDSRWCHGNFSLTYFFRPHYGPGVEPPSNRNEYQEYFLSGKGGRCVELTTLSPSCADFLEVLEASISWNTFRAWTGIALAFYHLR